MNTGCLRGHLARFGFRCRFIKELWKILEDRNLFPHLDGHLDCGRDFLQVCGKLFFELARIVGDQFQLGPLLAAGVVATRHVNGVGTKIKRYC